MAGNIGSISGKYQAGRQPKAKGGGWWLSSRILQPGLWWKGDWGK